jgi:uncharacterized glyoxalase superfamily protein PhnB
MNELKKNRSVPSPVVIPVLPYPDVRAAVAWLERVFGFTERLQITDHRAQMNTGDGGAVIVAEYIDRDRRPQTGADHASHAVMVRVRDVAAHHQHVVACGAHVLQAPVDHVYGERQYVVRDIGGHRWTFSETLFDADPKEWGGDGVVLKGE